MQTSPRLLADGTGGAIVAWQDCRDPPPDLSSCLDGMDVYAQRLGPQGQALWKTDGVALSLGPANQGILYGSDPTSSLVVASDGASGLIVAWPDGRNGGCFFPTSIGNCDIYIQRVSDTQAPIGPVISVIPSTLDLGVATVGGTVAERDFTVTNAGAGTLTGTAATVAPFEVVSGGTFSLQPGLSQTVKIRYTPITADAVDAAVVQFASNGGDVARSVIGSGTSDPTFTLTITKVGSGSGTVVSVQRGISCGLDCVESIPGGIVTNLTAKPAPGSIFAGWSGPCFAVNASSTVIMPSASVVVTAKFVLAPSSDFDGDGKADILWHKVATGEVAIFAMNGLTTISSQIVSTVNPAWSIVGVGDFDGDGRADILWRNGVTGEVAIFLMDGTTIAGSRVVGSINPACRSWAWETSMVTARQTSCGAMTPRETSRSF